MKSIIEFNKNTNSLTINDGLKNNSLIMNFLMFLNILNSALRVFKKNISDFEFYLWIFIGLISILVLLYKFFKTVSSKEIKVDNIKYLKIKEVFGNERFSLILKNGKKRIVIIRKNSSEIKNTISDIGIKIIS